MVTAEVYIHAARAAVWDKFTQLTDWPRWDSSILAARWVSGGAWQENARFELRQQGGFGATTTIAVIRMVVPGDTTVWEAETNAQIVHSAHFRDDLGGCKVQLRDTYHGLAVLTHWPWRGSQQSRLEARLHALKAYIERK